MTTTVTPAGRPARSGLENSRRVDLVKPSGTERTAVRTGAVVPRGTRRKKVAKRSQPPRSLIGRIKLLVQVILRRPGIAHLILAAKRFSERLGNQFAAAITYFTVLSLVPILMVIFAAAGFVLASRPDLLTQLQNQIAAQIPGGSSGVGPLIGKVLQSAVDNRTSVGIVGLVTALYSGIGWAGNIRAAVQAQWRPDFDDDQEILQASFIKNLIKNFTLLVSLGLALIVSLALSAAGVALSGKILGWLGLSDIAVLKPVFTAVPILIAVAADVIIFAWVYTALPPAGERATRRALLRGALMAAVGFEVLKFALTFFLPKVTNNATGSVFGPIIGLFFFFNLVGTVVLFVAAWIATSPGGTGDPDRKKPDSVDGAVPPPAVIVPESVSRPQAIGFVGVGTVLGLGLAARRRRR